MASRQEKMAHLGQGRLNVAGLRMLYRKEFLDMLDKTDGSKLIIWDKSLTGVFGFITEYSVLKEHGVTKMFIIEPDGRIGPCPAECRSVFFVLRPQIENMDVAAKYIKVEKSRGNTACPFYIILTPYLSLVCVERLKENGVDKIPVLEFGFDLLPLDNDLLSMEEFDFHAAFTLRRGNHLSTLHRLARGLMSIQALHGLIPKIYGKGHAAKQLCDNLIRMRLETDLEQAPLASAIDTLVLIDRNVDPLTPLLTQLTYEGLIDELIGIRCASVQYHEGRAGESEEKTAQLNSGDNLFAELRDHNFHDVGGLISRRAQLISAQIKEKDNIKSVEQVKEFVSKLPHMQQAKAQLATHISLADIVKNAVDADDFLANLHCQQDFCQGLNTDTAEPYIEAALAREDDLKTVLRLMCIQSYCNGGLKTRLLEYYRNEILQIYGYQHLLTLLRLEEAGFLTAQPSPTSIVSTSASASLGVVQLSPNGTGGGCRNFSALRKTLRLMVDPPLDRQDISQLYSGYAPLSVRLVQYLAQPGWRSITELLNSLPGPLISKKQEVGDAFQQRSNNSPAEVSSSAAASERPLTLVVFIGGVTYAEVSALRLLSQLEDAPTEYAVITTAMINGNQLLEGLFDKTSSLSLSDNPFE